MTGQSQQLSTVDRLRARLADFFVTFASMLRGDTGAKRGRFAGEVRLGERLATTPGRFAAGAQAWQGCLDGNYFYPYRISSGRRAGDVWLCCVPIDELLRESFDCGGFSTFPYFGSAADQKVQTCSLVDPVSEEARFLPACIPAPLEAPLDMSPPP